MHHESTLTEQQKCTLHLQNTSTDYMADRIEKQFFDQVIQDITLPPKITPCINDPYRQKYPVPIGIHRPSPTQPSA
jgi:hypothetical protein